MPRATLGRGSLGATATLSVVLALSMMAAACDPEPPARDAGVDSGQTGDDAGPDSGVTLTTDPPTSVSMVATEGFHSPTDAVASPDGSTFYFAAYTDPGDEPAIFTVPSAGGTPTVVVQGEPLSYPSGLVLSCDGSTLYIADTGTTGMDGLGETGAIYSLPVGGGALTPLSSGDLEAPNALAFDSGCTQLYVSGRTATGEGIVVRLDPAGGTPTTLHSGDPLVDPTGLNIDAANVAWVMDHLAEGPDGPGLLFRIEEGSAPSVVVSGLDLGTPAGVSLVAGGVTAVVPSRDPVTGEGRLLSISTATMAQTVLMAPAMIDPAGIRTARGANVMAVVDSEGGAIFRAE